MPGRRVRGRGCGQQEQRRRDHGGCASAPTAVTWRRLRLCRRVQTNVQRASAADGGGAGAGAGAAPASSADVAEADGQEGH